MEYKLNVFEKLNNNILHIETSITPESADLSNGFYNYRLRDDFKVIEEVKNVTESSWDFSLPTYGQYFVQISYSNEKTHLYKSSKLVLFCKSCPEEYEGFCNIVDNKTFPQLPYFEPDYPHQDFCIFKTSNLDNFSNDIENLQKDRNMHSHIYTENEKTICRVLTTHPIQNINGYDIAFSGVTRTDTHLVIGDKDLKKYLTEPEKLRSEVGDFWMIYQKNNNVHIIHDFLGLSKFYYYQNGNDFIVSNRYHLLLLALKAVNINPKPNIDRIIADLSSTNAFARLNYSSKMLFENTYVLTSDKDITINAETISFENNELHYELCNPEPYNESTYEALVRKGAQEMLDNMKLALEYPGVENFKIDLSGGLDSRMIYALITNFPQYREKVNIHALDLPNYPKDLSIALELNSIYDYPWFSIPINSRPISKKKSHFKILSGFLGINQQPMPVTTETSYKKTTIDMPGLLGEMVFRPHMYTKFKATQDEDNIDVAEFINKRIYYNIESISKKGMEYFSKMFIDEIETMPGKAPIQKFQNHYIMFMDTIHHSTYFTSSDSHVFQWMPLLSKTIFHLNNVTGIIFRSNKLAYDLLNEINPALTAIQYEKPLYNNELAELAKTNPHYAHTFKVADECIAAQRKKWEDAQKIMTENSTFEKLDVQEANKINKENARFFDDLKDDSLCALKKIIKYNNQIKNIVGLDCFSRICGNSDLPNNEKWLKFLYNKIMTVYYALRIFDYVD